MLHKLFELFLFALIHAFLVCFQSKVITWTTLILLVVDVQFRPVCTESIEKVRGILRQWRHYYNNLAARDLVTEEDWRNFSE